MVRCLSAGADDGGGEGVTRGLVKYLTKPAIVMELKMEEVAAGVETCNQQDTKQQGLINQSFVACTGPDMCCTSWIDRSDTKVAAKASAGE
jgi:hypothetical protein